jgi:hypothetical protein
MITETITKSDSMYTEGFVVETPSPLEVVVYDGELHFTMNEGSVVSYEAFAFDVEADPDFPVVYDIYLLEGGEVEVKRTVFVGTNVPYYDGELTLLYTLTSFQLPAGTMSLDDIEINVRKVEFDGSKESRSEGQRLDGTTEGTSEGTSEQ